MDDPGGEDDEVGSKIVEEVRRLKVVLDGSSCGSKEDVLSALDQLQAFGSLSTKILSLTLVGKSVHFLAKVAADPEVKSKARHLESAWRQDYKKRKSGVGDDLSLKRRNTSDVTEANVFSQDFEDLKDTGASQRSAASQGSQEEGKEAGKEESDKARAFDRAASTLSLSSQVGDKKDDYREKVRTKLIEALGKEEEIEAKGGESKKTSTMRDPVKLAEEIEEELHKEWPNKKDAYMNQARSILFNLKDTKNPTFRFKVVVGFFEASQLPKLTAEDMASEEKNAERAKQRQYAMEALDQGWALKNGQQLTTGMFTCGKCKGNKTTYFQMQTRSSDEPMTTFVTCLTCGNRWKFC